MANPKTRLVRNKRTGQLGIYDPYLDKTTPITSDMTLVKSEKGKYGFMKGNEVLELDITPTSFDLEKNFKKKVATGSSSETSSTGSTSSFYKPVVEEVKPKVDAKQIALEKQKKQEENQRFIDFGFAHLDYSGLQQYGAGGEFAADILDVPANLSKAFVRGSSNGRINQEITNYAREGGELDSDMIARLLKENRGKTGSNYLKTMQEKGILQTEDLTAVGGIAEVIFESLGSMTSTGKALFEGAVVGGATGLAYGAAAGATGGSIVGPVGTAVGGAGGAFAGVATGALIGAQGMSSYVNEYGSTIIDVLTKNGYDLTDPKQVEAGLKNKAIMDAAKEEANTRGLIVGGFDALTAGIAGKAAKVAVKVASYSAKQAGKELTKIGVAKVAGRTMLGIDVVGGSAGEALAQLATKGKISDPDAVVLEGIAEIGSGVPSNTYAAYKSGQINSEINQKNLDKIEDLKKTAEALPEESKSSKEAINNKIAALEKENKERNKSMTSALMTAPVPATQRVIELTDAIQEIESTLEDIKAGTRTDVTPEGRAALYDSMNDMLAERDEIRQEILKSSDNEAKVNMVPNKPMKPVVFIGEGKEKVENNNSTQLSPNKPLEVNKIEGPITFAEKFKDQENTKQATAYKVSQGENNFGTVIEHEVNGEKEFIVAETGKKYSSLDDAKFALQEKLTGSRVSELERTGVNRIKVEGNLANQEVFIGNPENNNQLDLESKSAIQRAVRALRSVSNANVYLYANAEEYAKGVAYASGKTVEEVMQGAGKANGQMVDANGENSIHINLEKAGGTTISHEVFHGALLGLAKKDPNAFVAMRDKILDRISEKQSLMVTDRDGTKRKVSAKEYLQDFQNRYSGSEYTEADRAEEFLSELAGLMSLEDSTVVNDKSLLDSIKLTIKDVLKKFNVEFDSLNELQETEDMVQFFKDFNRSVKTGEAINLGGIEGVKGVAQPTATQQQNTELDNKRKEELNNLGQKQLTKGFQGLQEAKNPKEKAAAISNIEQNNKQGAILSEEQKAALDKAKAELKSEGYEIRELTTLPLGTNYIGGSAVEYDGQILSEEQSSALESHLDKLEKKEEKVDLNEVPHPVAKTIKPMIMKDGKMIQAATVSSIVFNSVEQIREAIDKSKKAGFKQVTAADRINAKYATQEGQRQEVKDEDIILSGLNGGFKAVTPNSFDIRSDSGVMDKVMENQSFATSTTINGKKYAVVGLRLKQDQQTNSTAPGRNGYTFAAVEDNGNLPENIVDILTQKAVTNTTSVYPNITDVTIDSFKPIEVSNVQVSQPATKAQPAIKPAKYRVTKSGAKIFEPVTVLKVKIEKDGKLADQSVVAKTKIDNKGKVTTDFETKRVSKYYEDRRYNRNGIFYNSEQSFKENEGPTGRNGEGFKSIDDFKLDYGISLEDLVKKHGIKIKDNEYIHHFALQVEQIQNHLKSGEPLYYIKGHLGIRKIGSKENFKDLTADGIQIGTYVPKLKYTDAITGISTAQPEAGAVKESTTTRPEGTQKKESVAKVISRATKEAKQSVKVKAEPKPGKLTVGNTKSISERVSKVDGVLGQALAIEPTSPRDMALQYFIRGGGVIRGNTTKGAKPQPHTLVTLFTKSRAGFFISSKEEMDNRLGLVNNKTGLTITQIAEKLWESKENETFQFSDTDFRDAVESVLLDHISRAGMAKELVETKGSPAQRALISGDTMFDGMDDYEIMTHQYAAQELGISVEELLANPDKYIKPEVLDGMYDDMLSAFEILDKIQDEEAIKQYLEISKPEDLFLDELVAEAAKPEKTLEEKKAELVAKQKSIKKELAAAKKAKDALVNTAQTSLIEGRQIKMYPPNTLEAGKKVTDLKGQLEDVNQMLAKVESAIEFKERKTIDAFADVVEQKAEESAPPVAPANEEDKPQWLKEQEAEYALRDKEDLELIKLESEVVRAKQKISGSRNAEGAIADYNEAKAKKEAYEKSVEDRRQEVKDKNDLQSLIDDEINDSKQPKYEYAEEFKKDPLLAAYKRAQQMLADVSSSDYVDYIVEKGYDTREQALIDQERSIDNYERNMSLIENAIMKQSLAEQSAKAEQSSSTSGNEARLAMAKEIDDQLLAKENQLIEKQNQDIEKAKAAIPAIKDGNKYAIDEYVKKSGYKLITKEVIANNPNSELLKNNEGNYYNYNGASIRVGTAQQVALQSATNKANSKATGGKTTNQYQDAYNAISQLSKGEITPQEARSIIEQSGLVAPSAILAKTESVKAEPATAETSKVDKEIKSLQDEIEQYEREIEDATEEIENTKYNYKEDVAALREKKAEIRAQKMPRDEKEEALDEVDAEIEEAAETRDDYIEEYKEKISEAKREIKALQKKIDKLSVTTKSQLEGPQISPFRKSDPTYKYQMSGTEASLKLIDDIKSKYNMQHTAEQGNFIQRGVRATEKAISDNVVTRVFGGASAFVYKRFANNRANKAIGKPFAMLQDIIANNIRKGLSSQNTAAASASATTVAMIQNLGSTEGFQSARNKLVGGKSVAKNQLWQLGKDLNEMINNDKLALRRVHSLLDPEAFENVTDPTLPNSKADLSFAELRLFNVLRDMNDYIHEWHYENGFLGEGPQAEALYEKNKGSYFARMYNEIETERFGDLYDALAKLPNAADFSMFKERKDFLDVTENLTLKEDPIYITTKRFGQMMQNQAILQFCDYVSKSGDYKIYDKKEDIPAGALKAGNYRLLAPKKGGGKVYGKLTGKFVPDIVAQQLQGIEFSNQIISLTYQAAKVFDKSFARQVLSKAKTVWNPLTRAGNITMNFVFASLAGVDPVTLLKNRPAAKESLDKYDSYARDLDENGLLGVSMGKELNNEKDKNAEEAIRKVGKKLKEKAQGLFGEQKQTTAEPTPTQAKIAAAKGKFRKIASDLDDWLTESYGKSDDVAKVALYKSLVDDYGKTREEAINIVASSMQNYNTVGKAYDYASKSVNRFVKFKADSARILYNTFKDRPLNLMATLGMYLAAQALASKISGEDEEERKIRENRPYTNKIEIGPVNISLTMKFGDTEVNVARYLAPYSVYDAGYDSNWLKEATAYMPVQYDEHTFIAVNDPLIGPIVNLVNDKDFRGMPISDPGKTAYINKTVTDDEARWNRIAFAGRNFASPYWAWGENLVAAATGDADYYGRTRTVSEAVLNTFIKVQTVNNETLQKTYSGLIRKLDRDIDNAGKTISHKAREKNKDIREKSQQEGITDERLQKFIAEKERDFLDFRDEQHKLIDEKRMEMQEVKKTRNKLIEIQYRKKQ